MAEIPAQLYGMATQQGVLFPDLLVVQKRLGSCKLSYKIDCRGLTALVRETWPFSVRRGFYPSIILETV